MATDLARQLTARPIELVDLESAWGCYAQHRVDQGCQPTKAKKPPKLLTPPTANAKLGKGLKNGVFEYGLSLAPAILSVIFNVCRYSTPECRSGCVAYAGHGEMPWVIKARIIKTLMLGWHPAEFLTILIHELDEVWTKYGLAARVRLNNFSDLPWELIQVTAPGLLTPVTVFELFPRMRFYDYTKWGERAIDANLGAFEWPGNYRLTMSASEMTADADIVAQVNEGIDTAVLFDVPAGSPLPGIWQGVQVMDGDEHDDRWLDQKYSVIGLRAKGRMRKGEWNMVRQLEGSASD